MTPTIAMSSQLFLALFLLLAPTLAHISMSSPCPRYNAHGINCPDLPEGQLIDYEQNSPLARDAPLCKHTVPFPSPSAQWTAGQSVTVSFYGKARHSGGHCQFSLSYDGGNTFVVVYEIFGYCLHDTADGKTPRNEVDSHTFTLPSNLPSSNNAVFAWTWVNAMGNREFYMNCADIAISGTSNSYTGKQMTVANHNGYPTIEAFGGNYDMGKDVYDSAPTITVTGNGQVAKDAAISAQPSNPSSGSSSQNTNSIADIGNQGIDTINRNAREAPVGQATAGQISAGQNSAGNTLPPSSSSSTAAAVPSASALSSTPVDAPVPVARAAQDAGPCTLGEMRCGADTHAFDTCDHSGWISRPCAPGTSCKMSPGGGSPCV